MNYSIDRYDDHQWRVRGPGLEREILFSVESSSGQNEHDIIEAVAQSLVTQKGVDTTKKLLFDGRKVEVTAERPGLIKRAAQSIALAHPQGEKGIQKYKVICGSSRTAKKQQEQDLAILRARVPGATDAQLLNGCRMVATVSADPLPFDDVYTQLATHAYKYGYERNYSAKDGQVPEDSDCSLVVVGDKAELLLAKKPSEETVSGYKAFLEAEYGKRKVDEVQKAFGIDLSTAKRLTPEHVYRMNIGLRSIDGDDVEEFIQKLPSLKDFISRYESYTVDQLSEETGIPRHILRTFQTRVATSSDDDVQSSGSEVSSASVLDSVSEWIGRLSELPRTLGDCSEEQLDIIMEPFNLSSEASERAYTGRKIKKPLQAGYTTAEVGTEKLWIDRQELAQAFDVMANTTDKDLWLEKLDHVVVKANLLKGSGETGFYSSALIPAPLTEEGEKRWYKVTRCVSNGFGIFTYTLEPAGSDSKLPAIFLARSTASSEYALHGKDSLLNDFNALNPPGYEGQILNMPYDAKFFKKYSVPVWVGHMMHAEKLLSAKDIDGAAVALRKANSAIEKSFTKKCAYRGLAKLARDYDWLLNRIGLELSLSELVTSGYLGIYKKIMHSYVEGKEVSSNKEKEDAQKLVDQLKAVQKQLQDKYVLFGIDRLIGELEHNILLGDVTAKNAEVYNQFKSGDFAKLEAFHTQLYYAREIKDDVQVEQIVNQWYQALYARAKDRQELPTDKQQNGLIVTGQSLGGAISQVTIAKQFVDADRIPIGQVENYTISAPGIRHDDRMAFADYVGETASMRQAIGSSFAITHLTEAADFVFLAGQGHLGAVHEEDATDKLEGVKFYAAVREMIPGAFEYETVHATQFMEGKVGEHYLLRELSAKELALFEDAKHFISKNKAEATQFEKEARALKARFKFPKFLDETLVNKFPKNSLHLRRHIHEQRAIAPGGKQQDDQGVFLFEKQSSN